MCGLDGRRLPVPPKLLVLLHEPPVVALKSHERGLLSPESKEQNNDSDEQQSLKHKQNLKNQDILDAMDRIDAKVRVDLPLPPETSDWDTLRGQNKARRLKKVDIPLVVVEHDSTGESASTAVAPTPATAPAPSEKPFTAARLADNVIPFRRRSPPEQPTGTTAFTSRPLLQQNGN